MTLARNDPRHGTANGYTNLGCRCDACRDANTAYRKATGTAGYKRDRCPDCGCMKYARYERCQACEHARRRPPHGTESRYRTCRCDACRKAAADARRARRHANIEATRTYDRTLKRKHRAKVAA